MPIPSTVHRRPSATTEDAWFNYLVCRTGPARNNIKIATADAKQKGSQWNPYTEGFSRIDAINGDPEVRRMGSEDEVFAFVGLPFLKPWQRE